MSFFKLMENPPKRTFEECYDEIVHEVDKRRSKWHLDAVSGWCSWEDIRSILLTHIWRKFSQFDPDKGELAHWCQSICSSQIINQLRNLHGNYVSPCVRCICAEGDNLCTVYGQTQSDICPLVIKWKKSRQHAYNVKLPLYLENHLNEYYDRPNKSYDVEKTAPLLHEKMEEVLKPLEFRIYKILYIDNKTEEEAARLLGYKNTSAGLAAGQKMIKEAKKVIMITARAVVSNGDIDLIS
jgi:hypothetical protein